MSKLPTGSSSRGFTIIEVLVVAVVVSILASLAYVQYNTTQQRSRDTQRIATLERIAGAIREYKADNGLFPREADSMNGKVGQGAGIDALITPYLGTIPSDPFGGEYWFYYDGNHACGGMGNQAVVFIRKTEAPRDDHASCSSWDTEGRSGLSGDDGYNIVLGNSSG